MDLSIRVLGNGDFQKWNDLRTEALDAEPFAFGRSNEDELPLRNDRFASNTNNPERIILGAFDNQNLVGITGVFSLDAIKTQHKAMVWSVYVTSSYRGKGIGKKLMEKAVAAAWKMDGVEQLLIGVSSNNPAAFGLYKKLGFVEYGREPNCLKHNGNYTDEILMCLKQD